MASGPSGHIEQLPSGSWRAKVYAGTDPLTGREIRLRRTCRTERAAQIEPGKRFIEHPNVPLFAVDPASRRPAWQQVADTIGTRSAPGCWRRATRCLRFVR